MSKNGKSHKEWQQLVQAVKEARQVAREGEPEHRGPLAFGYRRCSHEDSRQSGLGLAVQIERVERYYEYLKATHPELDWGGWFVDEAVSAYKNPLITRKGGGALNCALQPGDHVIIPTLDRGFRDTEDLLNTVNQLWLPKQVSVHFLDINLDLSTPIGQLVMTIVGAVSRWEAAITSERNKAAAARLRAQNRPTNGTKRTGFKLANIQGHKQWVPDKRERRVLQEIVRLCDDEHKTFEEIARIIEPAVCQYEGRPYKNSAFHAWSWSPSKCRHCYRRYKEILVEEQ